MGLNRTPPPPPVSTSTTTSSNLGRNVATTATTTTTTTGTAVTSEAVTDTKMEDSKQSNLEFSTSARSNMDHPKFKATFEAHIESPEEEQDDDLNLEKISQKPEQMEKDDIVSVPDTEDLESNRTTPISAKPSNQEDPYPGMNFQERVKREPQQARNFFYEEMRRVGGVAGKAAKFYDAYSKVRSLLDDPNATAEEASIRMRNLQQAFDILQNHRRIATQAFTWFTKSQDKYLDDRMQMFKQVQENFLERFVLYNKSLDDHQIHHKDSGIEEEFKAKDISPILPPVSSKKFHCNRCAGNGFDNEEELMQHQILFHPENPLMRTMPLYQGSSQERNSTRYEEQKNNGQLKSTCAFKPVVSTMPQQPLLPTRMTSVVTTAQAMNVGSIYQESPRKLPLQLQYNVRPLVSQPTTTNLQPPHSYYPPVMYIPPQQDGQSIHQPQGVYPPVGQPFNNTQQLQHMDYPANQRSQDILMMTQVIGEALKEQMKMTEEREARREMRQEERHFNGANLCSVFEPEKCQTKPEIFQKFTHWLLELETLEKRMEELGFSEVRKYTELQKHVKGSAFRYITDEFPNEKSYEQAKATLKENFYRKTLATRDVYNKLKNLQKMPETNGNLCMTISTEAIILMNQLERRNATVEEVYYLLFTELLEPKLCKSQQEILDRLRNEHLDESKPWGHSLTTQHLKKCLKDGSDKIINREYNQIYNENKNNSNQNQAKKNQEENKGKGKKNTMFGQQTNSKEEGEDFDNSMPTNDEGTCPIPNCGAPLDKNQPGGHQWILHCPVMKKMKSNTLYKWFKKNKCKCSRCFSTGHYSENCRMTKIFCKEKMKLSRVGEECGKPHNSYLHWEKPPKKEKPSNSSKQTTSQVEQGGGQEEDSTQ